MSYFDMWLPDLVGSEKQVAWALDIRDRMIFARALGWFYRSDEGMYEAAAVLAETRASWWIDNRDNMRAVPSGGKRDPNAAERARLLLDEAINTLLMVPGEVEGCDPEPPEEPLPSNVFKLVTS